MSEKSFTEQATPWDATASPLWAPLRAQLGEEVNAGQLVALGRYVRALTVAETAWRQVPEHLRSSGSMGQEVAHPLIPVAMKADAAALGFGQALGLEPQPKVRPVGRPRGSAPLSDLTPASKKLRAVT